MSGAAIALYLICGREDAARIERHADLLSDDERAAARFQQPLPGAPSPVPRLARIALRRVLEVRHGRDLASAPFEILPSGRPVLPGAAVSFSVSHSDQYAVLAVAPFGIVGVDIEIRRRVRMSAARRARLISAAIALGSGPTLEVAGEVSDRFDVAELEGDKYDRDTVAAWTCLEAVGKADGRGIHWLLSALGVMGSGGAGPIVPPVPASVADYRVAQWTFPGPGAVALAHDGVGDGARLQAIAAGLEA